MHQHILEDVCAYHCTMQFLHCFCLLVWRDRVRRLATDPVVIRWCVNWRKSLRSLWREHPMTHCDVIAALSDQFPIMVSLEKRFTRFIKKCLSSSNSIVKVISHIAICNPMLNDIELDANGDYNTNQMVTSWQDTCESIKESIPNWLKGNAAYLKKKFIMDEKRCIIRMQ